MSCHCHGKCGAAKIAWILVLVGGLNWGLVGVGMLIGTPLNLVSMLLGSMPVVEAVVYLVVGISTIVSIFGCPCKNCKDASGNCAECKVEGDKPQA
jgi:uncharacterized membrane protein YuzA (DUF378 family)